MRSIRSQQAVLWAAVSISAVASIPSFGQTITDGNSSFNMPAANTTGAGVRTGTTGGTAAVFTAGGDTSDQLFQQWWWFRNSTSTREFGLSNRTGNTANGNSLRLEYSEPEGFRAVLTYVLTDGADSPASANISATLEIFNITNATLDLAVFNYLDYDLEGAATDGATLIESGRIGITDATGFAGEFLGVGANAYQVGVWPAVRDLLTNTAVNNLGNSGLPFAAADFCGAFQWNLSIPANGSATIRSAFALNMTADAGGNDCPGDLNADGLRELQDLAILLASFATNANGDLDGDGDTDLQDLANLLAVFGVPCP